MASIARTFSNATVDITTALRNTSALLQGEAFNALVDQGSRWLTLDMLGLITKYQYALIKMNVNRIFITVVTLGNVWTVSDHLNVDVMRGTREMDQPAQTSKSVQPAHTSATKMQNAMTSKDHFNALAKKDLQGSGSTAKVIQGCSKNGEIQKNLLFAFIYLFLLGGGGDLE